MESQKVRHDWATELNWWSDGTRCHDLRFWELSFYDVDDVTFPFVLFNLEVQIGATWWHWWIPATRNLRTYSSFTCSISRTLDTAKISLWVKLGSQNSASWNPLLVVLNSFFFFLMLIPWFQREICNMAKIHILKDSLLLCDSFFYWRCVSVSLLQCSNYAPKDSWIVTHWFRRLHDLVVKCSSLSSWIE